MRVWARAGRVATPLLVVLVLVTGCGLSPFGAPRETGPESASGSASSAPVPRPAPSSARPPLPSYDDYVALGDSFTAGPLIPQSAQGSACFRSTRNYPALLADRLDVGSFTDVSCSGVDSTHLRRRQPTLFGLVAPQLSALSHRTDLVTIGIGGNDFSVFGRMVGSCPTLRQRDPQGSPCRDAFRQGGRDTLRAAVERTGDRLVAALRAVRRRAPRADVVVVGYPQIAPARDTCPRVLPFASGDYRYANQVTRDLNSVLAVAARRSGAAYVDTYGPSRGHDVCAGAAAWVNGQRADATRAQAYHPFARYMRAVADLVTRSLSR